MGGGCHDDKPKSALLLAAAAPLDLLWGVVGGQRTCEGSWGGAQRHSPLPQLIEPLARACIAQGVIVGSALVKALGEAPSKEEGMRRMTELARSIRAAI